MAGLIFQHTILAAYRNKPYVRFVAKPGWHLDRDCMFCSERFEAKRNHRLFCSNKCRMRFNRQENLICFYCGELSNSRDHVFPHCAESNSARSFKGRETVNCCHECNSLLGSESAYFLEDRILSLADKIIKKYQLNKQIPEWSEDEFEVLGYNLRTAIEGKMRQRKRALDRLMHIRARHREVLLANDI